MVLSRVNAKVAFDHILNVVLGRGNDSGLKKALLKQNYNEINDFCTLTNAVIETLTYDVGDDHDITVTNGDKGMLVAFIDYIIHREQTGDPIGDAWTDITPEDFDGFRTNVSYIARVRAQSTGNYNLIPPPIPFEKKKTQADFFVQSIKRDQSLFPELKSEAYYDSWHRTFKNQARAQGLENVLDPDYVPSDEESVALLEAMKKYVYTLLEAKVQTDEGKLIIRKHEATFDAQLAYKELREHHLGSTKARLESASLLSYITTARYDPSTGKSAVDFVNYWYEKVRLYESQRESTNRFSDEQKRVMLENAVQLVPDLRAVKNTADMLEEKQGLAHGELSFVTYVALLKRAAANYDDARSKVTKVTRRALMHDLTTDDDVYTGDDSDNFNIDTPISVLQAHAHDRQYKSPQSQSFFGQRRISIPKERWSQLREETQAKWDTFDQSEKAIILGIGQSPNPNKSFQRPASAMRKINLHEMSAFDFLQLDESDVHFDDSVDHSASNNDPDESSNNDSTLLINAATSKGKLPPGDLRRVMSPSSAKPNKVQFKVDFHQIIYSVSESRRTHAMSLIDRGANGGVAGSDVRILAKVFPPRKVDIQGIDNHQMTDVFIGDVGGVVETQQGPVIAIFRQYALHGKGSTIHSSGQMEAFHVKVEEKSVRCQGAQSIVTPDGYYMPLVVHHGLARLPIRPYTDEEFDELPHVFMTNDLEWDPSVLDHNPFDDANWKLNVGAVTPDPLAYLYDAQGDYRHRVVNMSQVFARPRVDDFEENIDVCVFNAQHELPNPFASRDPYENLDPHDDNPNDTTTVADDHTVPPRPITARDIQQTPPDYAKLRPYFGWMNIDVIKKTLQHTTQLARIPTGTLLKRVFKSSNPALNVHRRNEPVACDVVYSDTPAIDDGSKTAVIFTGTKTSVTDVYGISSDDQFVNTLEDNIRERGAPYRLVSDNGSVIIAERVKTILRTLCISAWQSEPHQQQQNPAERRFQTVKNTANRILDRVGAPAYTWLLCLQYVCFLLNHTFNSTLGNVPLTALHGSTVDVSVLLRFHFYQKVYYMNPKSHFPSTSRESVGYIVGVSEHVGPALCWKILTYDTKQIIHRSVVRPHTDSDPNLRACDSLFDGETPTTSTAPVIQSPRDDETFNQAIADTAIIDYDDLIGATFLMEPTENGSIHRAQIAQLVDEHDEQLRQNPERIKYVCKIGNTGDEEILTYNQIMEYLSRADDEVVWKYKAIVGHQGPLKKTDPNYKGSSYNVKIEWENGETTYEALGVIAADDPVTCAIYAKEKGLLELDGWKKFARIAKREKKFTRMVNHSKLRSFNSAPRYKYGFEVARNYQHALQLDDMNRNTKWSDSVTTEMDQIDDYSTFEDLGHKSQVKPPLGYKKIRVHLVFDVKHDGRHKARLVADGHLTQPSLEGIYSGVVTLLGFRIVSFLADHNDLLLWATDVGNAYLEALTDEKVYIEAGPEFGRLCGHLLRIHKALYGLRTSSGRWAERCGDVLRDMGFVRCKAEQDIWLRRTGNCYEYVAVYVDDLALALKDPQAFVDELKTKYNFKLKGTGPIKFHLGMDITEEDDKDSPRKRVHCVSPTKYIERILETYKRMYGEYPKHNMTAPIVKGDHPELDDSELLDDKGIEEYQSLIGSLQWLISIGRFDIMCAVMTMSSFRAAPRKGHLDRVKKIFGYISKMRHGAIRIRVGEPDYSDLPHLDQDWARSVYGNTKEEIPTDAPEPLGKFVTTTSYVDANLFHCYSTGKAVTGIIHLFNQTPIEWYSKKQSTVETATYGSEFVASRTCVDQIFALRNTLRYLGVPIRDVSYMFGDNQSVVNSSMELHAKLHKRHTMLAFHRVRHAIASGVIRYHHIPGESNPADMMSKLWGYAQTWKHLRALLFWKGDTINIPE